MGREKCGDPGDGGGRRMYRRWQCRTADECPTLDLGDRDDDHDIPLDLRVV
ncbi:MAG: hypothetical protein V9F04_08090 [Dermatophilaceae bacterium]